MWHSVTYHFLVTVMTSDLVFRIIVSGHISCFIRDRNPKIGVWLHLGMAECCEPFSDHLDLDLAFRIFMSGAYLILF